MTFPNLSESQVKGLAGQVENYIQTQRELCRAKSCPLNNNQKVVMAPFFPEPADATRVLVLSGERVANPPFYSELVTVMGFDAGSLPDFSQMAAITFVDTVVFHQAVDNRTLFHELVHVIQYQKLGLPRFAAKYVEGFLAGGS
ncbi:MAG TPA: hypothetical protein VKB90_01740 [Candidatus Acidoferrum sp.]|nr:hypothetical protein [Candidatus Acidoferrum sp.]